MRAPHVTYKPGHIFRWEGTTLVLRRHLVCADGRGVFRDEYRYDFSDGFNVARLESFLFDLERHEVQEWLRIDGRRALTPHGYDP